MAATQAFPCPVGSSPNSALLTGLLVPKIRRPEIALEEEIAIQFQVLRESIALLAIGAILVYPHHRS